MFSNREAAGRQLASLLAGRTFDRPIVLALPRGGVPVGAEIARRLKCPLDLLIVRKIGVPQQPELAAGAIADGPNPQIIRNEDVIEVAGLTEQELQRLANEQLAEIARRRHAYVGDRQPPSLSGRTVILADDGVATGASMKAGIAGLRQQGPKRIVVAVPVAPADTVRALEAVADEVICLDTPVPFLAIGPHYMDFHQLSDREVMDILAQAEAAVAQSVRKSAKRRLP
jgi:putative phosphoribosyl transferase